MLTKGREAWCEICKIVLQQGNRSGVEGYHLGGVNFDFPLFRYTFAVPLNTISYKRCSPVLCPAFHAEKPNELLVHNNDKLFTEKHL